MNSTMSAENAVQMSIGNVSLETSTNFTTLSNAGTSLTNVTAVPGIEDESYDYPLVAEQNLASLFNYYATPCVALSGIICNVLALAVILGTKLRRSSAGHYLVALAIADTIELTAEFIKWVDKLSDIVAGSNVLCKIVNHARYTGQLWSAVLTTSITIERYFVVAFPLKVATTITTRKTKIIILLEFLICLALSSYGSIFFEIVYLGPQAICLLDFAQAEAYSYCNLIISKVFGEVLTNTLVFVFTGLIIKNLLAAVKFRYKNQESKGSNKEQAAERQLTVTLITVASCFFLTRTPYTITWYISHYRSDPMSDGYWNVAINGALNITYVLYMLNYAINFILYNLSGSIFRGHLVALLCPFRKTAASTSIDTSMTARTVVSTISKDEIPMSPTSPRRAVDSNANPRAHKLQSDVTNGKK